MLPICREKQVQLSRQYQQKTLAHAIILQGISGAGKHELAEWLIDLLICQAPIITNNAGDKGCISHACKRCKSCLLTMSGSYPDHLLLTSENKTLGVDDIRRGNAFLEKTAHLGLSKSILIPQAQLMTIAAANALLKTLEEPSANSYIILNTEDLDSLLPTIVSRCAVYAIRPMVGEALLSQLKSSSNEQSWLIGAENSVDTINGNAFINLSQLPELTNETTFTEFKNFNQCFVDYLAHGQNESKLLEQLIANNHSLRWLEKITCNLVRGNYLTCEPEQSNALNGQKMPVQLLNQIYQAIISSHKLIKSYTQANRQFVGEQLLMTINDIVRPST